MRTEFLKGTGGGAFAAPVKIADGGGSLPASSTSTATATTTWCRRSTSGSSRRRPREHAAVRRPGRLSDESFVWFENPGDAVGSAPIHQARDRQRPRRVVPDHAGRQHRRERQVRRDRHQPHQRPQQPAQRHPEVVRLTPDADASVPWAVSTVADGFTVTRRRRPGGPRVPGEGDLDGDGDIDLAVAGDADWSVYRIERKAGGGRPRPTRLPTTVGQLFARMPGLPGADRGRKNCGQGSVASPT